MTWKSRRYHNHQTSCNLSPFSKKKILWPINSKSTSNRTMPINSMDMDMGAGTGIDTATTSKKKYYGRPTARGKYYGRPTASQPATRQCQSTVWISLWRSWWIPQGWLWWWIPPLRLVSTLSSLKMAKHCDGHKIFVA
ncbi:hypothetical protein GBAR_LOCUS8901 [Geodia barretti]|uniref:Uncharacterized protein n=1 Tax=Geodia barretti TaxID=519541 RepID=A0AA35RNW6_GEOBA|nr:hypothetical protein GBAR_LOCUS8901 [Geodia barretti]